MKIYIVTDIILIDGDKGQSYINDKLNPHMAEISPIIIDIMIICIGDFAVSRAPIAGTISRDPIRKAPINFILTAMIRASIKRIKNSMKFMGALDVLAIDGSIDIITI